ncbi:hypothetical protein GF325_18145 [Candidatus Bathyarchaeota archaeon]|nr:hypothetical protein [Candidatus Bathyarchaeota archaeon]
MDGSMRLQVPRRFLTLDLMKGIGLLFIFYAHLGLYWTNGTWESLWEFQHMLYRPIGPANYTICSIIGLLFSLSKSEYIFALKGKHPRNLSRIIKRALIFTFIGSLINVTYVWPELFNPAYNPWYTVLRILCSWNIITFIGVAQLVVYFTRKLNVKVQMILAILPIVAYYVMAPIIIDSFGAYGYDSYKDALITGAPMNAPIMVYFLFFYQNSMAPFFPWISIAIFTSIVYGHLMQSLATGRIDNLRHAIRKVKYVSLAFLVAGIVLGIQFSYGTFETSGYGRLIADEAIRTWNPAWPGFPLFLHMNHPTNMIYSFGLMSLITMFLLERIDLGGRQPPWLKSIAVCGKYSLTIFVTHGVTWLVPLSLGFFLFLPVFTVVTISVLLLVYYWDKKHKGMGSIEWATRRLLQWEPLAMKWQRISRLDTPGPQQSWHVESRKS